MTDNPNSDGKADETGTLFVDILFALVVGQLLMTLTDPDDVLLAGGFHIAVALTLTILSWIGYHNSQSRADARLEFPNVRPLNRIFGRKGTPGTRFAFWQFLLDILMVVVYWVTSFTFERPNTVDGFNKDLFWYSMPTRVSAFPETAAVWISFLLYVLWDCLSRREARAEKAEKPNDTSVSEKVDRREKRKPASQIALGVTTPLLPLAFLLRSDLAVMVIDSILILILLSYRFYKEVLTLARTSAPTKKGSAAKTK